jgi:hypothetical protein
VEALTPASADDLPPLAELIADDPFLRHPAVGLAREDVAHLRVWTTATDPPGRSGPSSPAGTGPTSCCSSTTPTRDRRRRGDPRPVPHRRRRQPHWLRVWPTPEENPRHAGLELWMAVQPGLIEGCLAGTGRARVCVRQNYYSVPARYAGRMPAPPWPAWRRGALTVSSRMKPDTGRRTQSACSRRTTPALFHVLRTNAAEHAAAASPGRPEVNSDFVGKEVARVGPTDRSLLEHYTESRSPKRRCRDLSRGSPRVGLPLAVALTPALRSEPHLLWPGKSWRPAGRRTPPACLSCPAA